MTALLHVLRAGPLSTVQDQGRPGRIGDGLSPGGAMDRLALLEAAALLGLERASETIEMAGMGGRFRSDAPLRFALTGARMDARIDGVALRWNATHCLRPGEVLDIRGTLAGNYGYMTPAAGILTDPVLDSRAAHLSVGLGRRLQDGDQLPLGHDPDPDRAPCALDVTDRLSGGLLRLMPGPQTDMFTADTRTRFAEMVFTRAARSSRTGAPLDHDGAHFAPRTTTSPVSDFITAGDVQITGDGRPFIMMAECQTVGGYPRIGTIIAEDMPRAVQAAAGAALRFAWITSAQADAENIPQTAQLRALASRVQPLLRDPADIPDLLSYQLIGGATAGHDPENDP